MADLIGELPPRRSGGSRAHRLDRVAARALLQVLERHVEDLEAIEITLPRGGRRPIPHATATVIRSDHRITYVLAPHGCELLDAVPA